ncbi:MAG: hypothetical protein WAV90_16255 [Gordonia amarae]
MAAVTATANGSAAPISDTPVAKNNTVAPEQVSPYAKKKVQRYNPKTETYEQRQERIAKQKRPVLRQSAETKNEDTTCVSSEFTTLSVVFDSIYDSLLPSLPPAAQAAVKQQQKSLQRSLKNVTVSTLSLTDNPLTLGADNRDPSTKYRTPISQYIVSQLLKIRDGKQNDAIPVTNITLSQAVETAWLYFFVGVLSPIQFAIGVAPVIGDAEGNRSPLAGLPSPLNMLGSFVSYNTLLSIFFAGGNAGLTALYNTTTSALLNQCVARVTEEQKENAGKAHEQIRYNIPLPAIITSTAKQLALADSDSCRPVGANTLGEITERTIRQAKESAPNASARNRVAAQGRQIQGILRGSYIPHNLIPADKADFTGTESMVSTIGGFIPFLGGAPVDVLLGLGHNLGQGANLGQQVPLSKLTVTKSLTGVYYTYALSVWLFKTVGQVGTTLSLGGIFEQTPIGKFDPFRTISTIATLPLTYGLVTYHNVVRSMCFTDDDTTGSGLGAEAHKRKDESEENIAKNKEKADKESTGTTKRASSTTTKKPAPASEENKSAPTKTRPAPTKKADPDDEVPPWIR